MPIKKQTFPDWTYLGDSITKIEDFPEGTIGFVYKLTLSDGSYYVGSKQIISIRGLQSNWKVYNGSSKTLTEDLKASKITVISREILEFAISKQQLLYLETCQILCGRSLEDKNSRNAWISAKIYKSNLIDPKPMKITQKRKKKK